MTHSLTVLCTSRSVLDLGWGAGGWGVFGLHRYGLKLGFVLCPPRLDSCCAGMNRSLFASPPVCKQQSCAAIICNTPPLLEWSHHFQGGAAAVAGTSETGLLRLIRHPHAKACVRVNTRQENAGTEINQNRFVHLRESRLGLSTRPPTAALTLLC